MILRIGETLNSKNLIQSKLLSSSITRLTETWSSLERINLHPDPKKLGWHWTCEGDDAEWKSKPTRAPFRSVKSTTIYLHCNLLQKPNSACFWYISGLLAITLSLPPQAWFQFHVVNMARHGPRPTTVEKMIKYSTLVTSFQLYRF